MRQSQYRTQWVPHWSIRSGLFALLSLGAVVASAQAQTSTPAEIDSTVREQEREKRQQKAEDERVRRLVQDAAAQAKETARLAADLEGQATALVERLNALLSNDDGKRLASDAAAFFNYTHIRDNPFISLDRIKSKKLGAEAIRDGLEKELKAPSVGYTPNPTLAGELSGTASWSRDRLEWIATQQSWLDAVIARVPKDLDVKAAKTLKQVIDDYNADRLQAWARAQAKGEAEAKEKSEQIMIEKSRMAALEKAQADAEQRLREALAQIASMKADFEVKLKQQEEVNARKLAAAEQKLKDAMAEIERERKVADAQRQAKGVEAAIAANKVVGAAEKKRLIERCKEPEVQCVLPASLHESA